MTFPRPTDKVSLCSTSAVCACSARSPSAGRSPPPPTSLAYTQSAVSQQIAALEREAGTRLVERNARGVRLTDAGRALVEHADAILARLADAEAELEAIAGLRGGRLRLAAFPSAGRDDHARGDRALPRPPSGRRAHARARRPRARARQAARGRGRPRPRHHGRVPPAARGRHRARAPARRPDVRRAAAAATRSPTSATSSSRSSPTSRGSSGRPGAARTRRSSCTPASSPASSRT